MGVPKSNTFYFITVDGLNRTESSVPARRVGVQTRVRQVLNRTSRTLRPPRPPVLRLASHPAHVGSA